MMAADLEIVMKAYRKAGEGIEDGPHGWVQWKGTDACVDLHCICGYLGHIDSDFFYRYRCRECGRRYAVGQYVRLIELTDEEAAIDFHKFREAQ